MKSSHFILFYILYSSSITIIAQNQGCSDLTPESSDLGYKSFENRCEGYYIPKYAGSLQLVSLTNGPIRFSLTDSTMLSISLSKKIEMPVNIRAVSLPRNVHYRLDASLNNETELKWSKSPYLVDRNLDESKVGVYGWIGSEDDKTFIPVTLKEVGTTINVDSLIIKFRPISDLTHFRWRLYDVDDENRCMMDMPLTKQNDYSGEMNAGNIIEITVPTHIIGQKKICMEVKYRPQKKGWYSNKLKFNLGEY